MAWRDLFKRRESADEALLAVATQQGWAAQPQAGALGMMPPTHAAVDLYGLDAWGAPPCGGRSFQAALQPGGAMARISHLQVWTSDEQEDVYDSVIWSRAAGTVPRFEAELGAGPGSHHRLGDRFKPHGAASMRLASGAVLRLSRGEPAALAQAWQASPRWAAMMAAAGGELRGCVAEGRGDQLAVFTWTGMPRPGRQRWLDLLAVAQELESLFEETAGLA